MLYIWHLHNNQIYKKVGDKISKGELIALTGNKAGAGGQTTGAHSHTQAGNIIYQDNHIPYYDHTIDPTSYIPSFGKEFPISGSWGEDYMALKPPIMIGGRYHAGIDKATPINTPLYAPVSGTVVTIIPDLGAICYSVDTLPINNSEMITLETLLKIKCVATSPVNIHDNPDTGSAISGQLQPGIEFDTQKVAAGTQVDQNGKNTNLWYFINNGWISAAWTIVLTEEGEITNLQNQVSQLQKQNNDLNGTNTGLLAQVGQLQKENEQIKSTTSSVTSNLENNIDHKPSLRELIGKIINLIFKRKK